MIAVHTRTSHRYDIQIGRHILADAASFIKHRFAKSRIFVVIDDRVSKLHGDFIQRWISFSTSVDYCWYEVPEGEASKSWEQTKHLVDYLLHQNIKRNEVILAFGGGVVGDLAAFAASIALRGVPVVHFPTTLLAMVDSAIGGKTGINHETGKNRIGTFYQPEAVYGHLPFLETLNQREWLCGFGEIIKYGFIDDPSLLEGLDSVIKNRDIHDPAFEKIIQSCAAIKTRIVNEDEKEQGIRAYLNFGHTFGHAVESELGYGEVSHGAAIFLGMIAAAYTSEKVFNCKLIHYLEPLIPFYQTEIPVFEHKISDMVARMHFDKKNKDGSIRLVLIRSMAEPCIHSIEDEHLLVDAFTFAQKLIHA